MTKYALILAAFTLGFLGCADRNGDTTGAEKGGAADSLTSNATADSQANEGVAVDFPLSCDPAAKESLDAILSERPGGALTKTIERLKAVVGDDPECTIALDHLLYAYLQTGQDLKAMETMEAVKAVKIPAGVHPDMAYAAVAAEPRWTLERHDWEAAAAIMPRQLTDYNWDAVPQFEAMSFFAIAIGAARSGDKRKATAAIMQLLKLEHMTKQPYWGSRVKVMRMASQAWLHEATGNHDQADSLMAESAKLEANIPQKPEVQAILPSGELLGALLMSRGKHAEAFAAFESVLGRAPNRFNSLYGAGRAAEEMGDSGKAAEYYGRLVANCQSADTNRPELAHAREFVAV